jgi:hypothetical protein
MEAKINATIKEDKEQENEIWQGGYACIQKNKRNKQKGKESKNNIR